MCLIKYYFIIIAILVGINSGTLVLTSQAEDNITARTTEEDARILDEIIYNEQKTSKPLNTDEDLPKQIQVEKDGSVMMLVPAGAYWRGIKGGTTNHDAPYYKVFIDAFYIDKCEVTNKQYEKFLEETGHREPNYWRDPRFDDPMFPVVGVHWADAVAYAEWAGKRLPTEAEWEKAARGGLESKLYPWGNELTKEHANYHSLNCKPVASYSPNGYGLFDMAGNVWEWTADYYSPNYYGMASLTNPQGPKRGRFRILRGGAFNTSPQSLMCGHRHSYDPELSMYFIGFRCVKDVE